MADIMTDTKEHSIILKEDVRLYLKESFLSENRVSVLGENACKIYFNRLLSVLTIPPSFTVIRMNCMNDDDDERQQQLIKTLNESLISSQEKRLIQLSPPCVHPELPDTAIIQNVGPSEGIEKLKSEIIVDHSCGMSVLRGSEIFVQGILGAPFYLKRGDPVSVYAALDGCCLRGQTRRARGNKLFLGNGESTVNRQELFCNNKNEDDNQKPSSSTSSLSGVGVKMNNALYSAPRLDILNTELFFAQNLPSVVCGYVLDPQPDETILDMCAAPGGKTTHIATLMKNHGRIIALDRTPAKIQRVSSIVSSWGITCVETYPFDSTKALQDDADMSGGPPYPPASFNRILLDAPCSALGQRPTYRNNTTLSNLKSYPSYQRKLITRAVGLLKPGGTLVFSTCTITLEENENQVAWILQTFPELILSLQTPHLGGIGLPGSLLTEQQQKLVQRFDPVSIFDDDSQSKNYNLDTIGFFIAKFVKRKNTEH